MENFMTWETLLTYTTFVSTIFMVVEFTKELPLIKKFNSILEFFNFIGIVNYSKYCYEKF